jgi:hypothetical protein
LLVLVAVLAAALAFAALGGARAILTIIRRASIFLGR